MSRLKNRPQLQPCRRIRVGGSAGAVVAVFLITILLAALFVTGIRIGMKIAQKDSEVMALNGE